jgi:hypothetical protein
MWLTTAPLDNSRDNEYYAPMPQASACGLKPHRR